MILEVKERNFPGEIDQPEQLEPRSFPDKVCPE
jgi:hypothetical protein